MQGSDEKNYKRSTDFTEEGREPSIQDSWHLAGLAHSRINEIKVEQDLLKRAFMKDDLGTPDYDGHRRSHKDFLETEKVVKDYKVTMTKEVLKAVVSFAFGILVFALTSYLKG